jgi:hypothetical protein
VQFLGGGHEPNGHQATDITTRACPCIPVRRFCALPLTPVSGLFAFALRRACRISRTPTPVTWLMATKSRSSFSKSDSRSFSAPTRYWWYTARFCRRCRSAVWRLGSVPRRTLASNKDSYPLIFLSPLQLADQVSSLGVSACPRGHSGKRRSLEVGPPRSHSLSQMPPGAGRNTR